MDKTVAGVLGAVGAVALAGASHASSAIPVDVESVMHVDTYADLLKPIPNAVAVQKALAEQGPVEAVPDVMTVQYYRHHHHHHHHRYYRRYHHHHHHHHHHHSLRLGPVIIR